jgi:hypothetical protein
MKRERYVAPSGFLIHSTEIAAHKTDGKASTKAHLEIRKLRLTAFPFQETQ